MKKVATFLSLFLTFSTFVSAAVSFSGTALRNPLATSGYANPGAGDTGWYVDASSIGTWGASVGAFRSFLLSDYFTEVKLASATVGSVFGQTSLGGVAGVNLEQGNAFAIVIEALDFSYSLYQDASWIAPADGSTVYFGNELNQIIFGSATFSTLLLADPFISVVSKDFSGLDRANYLVNGNVEGLPEFFDQYSYSTFSLNFRHSDTQFSDATDLNATASDHFSISWGILTGDSNALYENGVFTPIKTFDFSALPENLPLEVDPFTLYSNDNASNYVYALRLSRSFNQNAVHGYILYDGWTSPLNDGNVIFDLKQIFDGTELKPGVLLINTNISMRRESTESFSEIHDHSGQSFNYDSNISFEDAIIVELFSPNGTIVFSELLLVNDEQDYNLPDGQILGNYSTDIQYPSFGDTVTVTAIPEPGYVFQKWESESIYEAEDLDGDGRLDTGEDLDGDGNLDVDEDLDGDGNLDVEEDIDGDGNLDVAEDLDGDGNLDVDEDIDGDGWLDVPEDIDGDGNLDVAEDVDGDGILDPYYEDVDGDGWLDLFDEDLDGDGLLGLLYEDLNGNGILDPGEDVDGDGYLDFPEDMDGDGYLDVNEDIDGDGNLDVNEDIDGDGNLDVNEDVDGDGVLNLVNEDVDGDGNLDVAEDVDGDGILDPYYEDVDGDGNLDVHEDIDGDGNLDVAEDLDGDGNLDVDEDLDGDGNLDVNEDVDGDGILDLTEDLDNDGHFDIGESIVDLNGDGILSSHEDVNNDGTHDLGEDRNANGILDLGEDINFNGILDKTEDLNQNGIADFGDFDFDGDGRFDTVYENFDNDGYFDAFNEDLDGDGNFDDINEDRNGNGLLDSSNDTDNPISIVIDRANVELKAVYKLDDSDTDQDGLDAWQELLVFGTIPGDADSDDDGLIDGDEVLIHETNPNTADSDSDWLSDQEEIYEYATDPNDSDSDNDGVPDFREALDAVVEQRNNKYSLDEIKDLRIGSTTIQVIDGTANIDMDIQSSTDLKSWEVDSFITIPITIEPEENIKFFRFKMPSNSNGNEPQANYSNSQFMLVEGDFTWHEAKLDAEARGGHLATFSSMNEWTMIQTLLGPEIGNVSHNGFWIGATDEENEGQWSWVTGEEWHLGENSFSSIWASGQPDNAYGGEDYIHVHMVGVKLNDLRNRPIDSMAGYILEIPID